MAKGSEKTPALNPQTSRVAAEDLPRRTLGQVLPVAKLLHNTYAGKSASWDEIAEGLQLRPQTAHTKYTIWSAQAYGLIQKQESPKKEFALAETGRKIVAPTYEGEDREAILKAILTPTILSKFYSDYNGHPIPGPQHFANVLENRFGVPRDRTEEAISIILENAKIAGILIPGAEGEPPTIDLGAQVPVKTAPPILPTEVSEDVGTAASQPAPVTTNWSKTCFFITPIDAEGSEIRKHADMMLKHLISPAAEKFGLEVIRADKIAKSGLITQQIFEHLARAKVSVADLSFSNPNVFYELGVRHMCRLPTVQIIRKGDKIPFDISQGRTITIDTSDTYLMIDRLESARRELVEHLTYALTGKVDGASEDNPINVYLPGIKVTIPS